MRSRKAADSKLRVMVEEFKRKGLPFPVSLEEAKSALNKEQLKLLGEFVELGEQERKLDQRRIKPRKGNALWRVREVARKKFQEAVLIGLIHLRFIQEHAIGYGAIPDPNEGWKYYRLPDGNYACWRCGSDILCKEVSYSVHFAEFRGPTGGGEVRRKTVPWCPKCEQEPPAHGFITESVADAFAEDRKKRLRVFRAYQDLWGGRAVSSTE